MRDLPERWRRWSVPGIPFLLSLGLSVSTLSPTVFWQDSGFFLTAVHEMSVLYPHGFVLYLVLCKGWTLLAAPLVGFTVAVHLFSALCAAGAAGFLASASRAFLRRLDSSVDADLPAAATGCLVAAGYSFGAAAILAKPYALFYLLCAALIWSMATAEKKRDFLVMGGLLGLAWAAHPSAALLLPAMLVYAALRRDRIREWGRRFFGGVVLVSASAAFLPTLLLPVLAARESAYSFSDPRSIGEVLNYVFGKRYVAASGAFGLQGDRWVQASRFFWEEYLGVGLLLLGLGAWTIVRNRSKALLAGIAWVVTVAGVALVFLGEGQFDLWLVAVYLPLSLGTAAGLQVITRKGRAYGAVAAAAGVLWMVLANHADLDQRKYPYAELYARFLLKDLEPGAPLLLTYDDSVATVAYLQAVKGERTDVAAMPKAYLGLDWYDRVVARKPGLRVPDWKRSWEAMPGLAPEFLELNAFANENAAPGRPVYMEQEPDRRFLRPDLAVVPAGLLWRVVVRGEAVLDPKFWNHPVDLRALATDIRRPRGVTTGKGANAVARPEPFEHRLIIQLLHARLRLADTILETAPQGALEQYTVVRDVWPAFLEDSKFLLQWGRALYLCGKLPEAGKVYGVLLTQPDLTARMVAQVRSHLCEIALSQGKRDEARAHLEAAQRTGALDPLRRRSLEERLGSP